tara:strand:+ start:268 stop:375 length:108 start_codon:yes stop_codon:yes gene_type:complete
MFKDFTKGKKNLAANIAINKKGQLGSRPIFQNIMG